MNKRYKTIYADPPWWIEAGGPKRGANWHYPLMRTEDICALPVKDLADKDAHLYLWTTNAAFPEALTVIRAWGFKYITCITWVKNTVGFGQYFRGMTEHCLFARRGMPPPKMEDGHRVQGRTVFFAKRTVHSRKPKEMREIIERVSYGPRLELFAREQHDGWDVWGNEVDGIKI